MNDDKRIKYLKILQEQRDRKVISSKKYKKELKLVRDIYKKKKVSF